jgi:hypothetical protein
MTGQPLDRPHNQLNRVQFSLRMLMVIMTGSAIVSGVVSSTGVGSAARILAQSLIVGTVFFLPIAGTIFIATSYRRTSELYHRIGPWVLYAFVGIVSLAYFVMLFRHAFS